MESITSKRGLFSFYCKLFIISVTLVLLGSILILVWTQKNRGNSLKIDVSLLFGIAIILYAIFNIYGYFKSTPKIRIDKKSIQVGRKLYKLSNISEVLFTGKHHNNHLLMVNNESTKILFSNGDAIYINESLYENASPLKVFLEKILKDSTDDTTLTIKQPDKTVATNQIGHLYYYKGWYINSVIGITIISVGIFACINLVTKNAPISLYIFFTIFLLLFQLLFVFRFYYFGINENCLVIKNIFIFWNKKVYPLWTIREIVFETASKKPNGMRVITKDFKTKLYYAGTLTSTHWLELKEHLEKENISVRNELNL